MQFPDLGISFESLGLEKLTDTSDHRFSTGGNIEQSGTKGLCKQYVEDFEAMLRKIQERS